MKHISSRAAAYTVLYAGVIFGIFVLQFTKGKTFFAVSGSMQVSGRYELSETGEKIPLLPLHIVCNGLDLYINEQHSLYALYAEHSGAEHTDGAENPLSVLEVRSYTMKDGIFTVQCTDDVSLTFSSTGSGDADTLTIEAALPEHITQVLLPWKITQDASIERDGGRIHVRKGERQYSFVGDFSVHTGALPGLDAASQEIPHLNFGKTQSVAYYKTYIPYKGLDIQAIGSQESVSAEAYAKVVEAFNTAVIQHAQRVQTAQKMTEPLAAAFLAEMGQRGLFEQGLSTVPAQSISKTVRTYRTNPFYNSLQHTHPGLIAANRQRLDRVIQLINSGDPDLFAERDIIPFLLNHEHKNTVEKALAMIETLIIDELTAIQAAGVLAFWMDCLRYYPSKNVVPDEILGQCEKKIIDSLLLTGEQLYLSDDGVSVNTVETLRAAHTLRLYGTHKQTGWQGVGRLLVMSLFHAASQKDSLPASFTIEKSEYSAPTITADTAAVLDGGTLYPLVNPDTAWYPHAQSLALEAEPGIWAWTCAQEIAVLENTAKTILFRVRFPQGASHYLTLHGIRPFYRIDMYGIPFRSDARFESYNSSGYAYKSDSKTLYLKMRHKAEYEFIRLYFGTAPQ